MSNWSTRSRQMYFMFIRSHKPLQVQPDPLLPQTHKPYIIKHSVISSVVNGKPVCGFSFVSVKNNEIRKEYLGTSN